MKKRVLALSTVLAVNLFLSPSLAQIKIDPSKIPIKPFPIILSAAGPIGATSVQDYFKRLQEGDVPQTGQTGTRSLGRINDSKQAGASGPMNCSVERFSVSAAPPQYATGNFDQDKIWVGSLLQTEGLTTGVGSLKVVNVAQEKRSPLRLTTTLPTSQGSQEIAPSQSDYNRALAIIRQAAASVPFGSTATRFETAEETSFEASALKAGLNVSYLLASANGSFGLKHQTGGHKLTAVFVQNAFTVNADLGGLPPAQALLGKLTVPELQRMAGTILEPGEFSYGNPPAYVDSITYGRLLMVTMESNYNASEMEAALRASYATASGSFSTQQQQVLNGSKFSAYASGGNEQYVIDLIRTGRLEDYFKGPASATALVPISFTTRNLGDGSYAVNYRTGEYAVTQCVPDSLKVGLRVTYQSIRPNDSRYDDLYGELDVDGQRKWQVGQKQHFAFYPRQTFTLLNAPGFTVLNYSQPRQMNFVARLMDYDSTSPDDVVGLWNENIDLGAVADQFSAGASTVVLRFPKRGDDDASGTLTLEFFR